MIDSPGVTASTPSSTHPRTTPICAGPGAPRSRGKSLRRLEEVIARCRDRDIDSMIRVSPGLSCATPTTRTNHLWRRRSPRCRHGSNSIALLFDDIPDRSPASPTCRHFPTWPRLMPKPPNRVFDGIAVPFVVCPTIYWGAGDEEYISRLGDQGRPTHLISSGQGERSAPPLSPSPRPPISPGSIVAHRCTGTTTR